MIVLLADGLSPALGESALWRIGQSICPAHEVFSGAGVFGLDGWVAETLSGCSPVRAYFLWRVLHPKNSSQYQIHEIA